MKKNQTKSVNSFNLFLEIIAMILATITVISSSIGLYAWARYVKSIQGTPATAKVAKWYFNLKEGTTTIDETERTLLAVTRTDGLSRVAVDKIAPGTSGVLPIIVDSTGTETDLTYNLTITVNNCPQNLIFTPQTPSATTITTTGAGTNESPRVTTINISKYVPYTEVGEHNESITWDWPYETSTGNGVSSNDRVDTADADKTVTVTITAVGTEVLEEPSGSGNSSGFNVKVGDKILYNPDGTYVLKNKYAAVEDGEDVTLSSEDNQAYDITEWIVLSVDNATGNIEMVPVEPVGNLTLQGAQGYNNGVYLLNEACSKLYSGPEGSGITARSINEEDFAKAAGTSWTSKRDTFSYNVRLNGDYVTMNYEEQYEPITRSARRYYPVMYSLEKNNVIDGTEQSQGYDKSKQNNLIEKNANGAVDGYLQATQSINPYSTYFHFASRERTIEAIDNELYESILFPQGENTWYFVASRCIQLTGVSAVFFMFNVSEGYFTASSLFYSTITPTRTLTRPLFPVVSLNKNVLNTTNETDTYIVNLD